MVKLFFRNEVSRNTCFKYKYLPHEMVFIFILITELIKLSSVKLVCCQKVNPSATILLPKYYFVTKKEFSICLILFPIFICLIEYCLEFIHYQVKQKQMTSAAVFHISN